VTTQQTQIALFEAARSVAVAAESLEKFGGKHVRQISRDGARNARKDVAEAIVRLQRFHALLSDCVAGQ
jgi:hypothetical protein